MLSISWQQASIQKKASQVPASIRIGRTETSDDYEQVPTLDKPFLDLAVRFSGEPFFPISKNSRGTPPHDTASEAVPSQTVLPEKETYIPSFNPPRTVK
jgi:hypothetical protein